MKSGLTKSEKLKLGSIELLQVGGKDNRERKRVNEMGAGWSVHASGGKEEE